MIFKKWTIQHTKGLLLGLLTPLACIPLVIFILSWLQNFYFEQLWFKFSVNSAFQIKILTLSCIANLIWFYIFLNREKYNMARGVIIGTMLFAPYVIYVKFF